MMRSPVVFICVFVLVAHALPHQQDESPKADTSQIKFFLYTRSNRVVPQEIAHDQSNLGSSNYVKTKMTYFLIHGWNSDIDFADGFRKGSFFVLGLGWG
jgi:hypothetical protein